MLVNDAYAIQEAKNERTDEVPDGVYPFSIQSKTAAFTDDL